MNEVNTVGANKFVPVRSGTTSSAPANEKAASSEERTTQAVPKEVEDHVEKKVVEEAPRSEIQHEVREAVAQMNEFIQSSQRDLHFSYDADSGDTIVQVVDRTTQEVIRQIPDEIFLKLANQAGSGGQVQLFSAQA